MKACVPSLRALVLGLIIAESLYRQGFALRLPGLQTLGRGLGLRGHDAISDDSVQDAVVSSSNQDGERYAWSITEMGRKDFADGDDTTIRNHWALLVAGSAGWSNYRHQADVCHAYQVLVRGGLRPSRIIVMLYDDIATDPENPFPGKVFNKPGGPDVYAGVRVDYRGADVTAATFLAVLEGQPGALPPGTGGSGRVVASGPYDRVFVFYSDHGSPGVLGMPSGSFLYADQLVAALTRKYEARGYKEAVLYIEACESGSMFEGLLPANISAYATTAANAFESSWGTYCPGMVPGAPPVFSTCLGDLYSVAWMENAERCDLTRETLMTQYDIVRNRTSHNFTYWMGSHVMQYGTLAIQREVAGDYQGMRNRGGGGGGGEGDEDGGGSCRPGPGPPPTPSPTPFPDPSPSPSPSRSLAPSSLPGEGVVAEGRSGSAGRRSLGGRGAGGTGTGGGGSGSGGSSSGSGAVLTAVEALWSSLLLRGAAAGGLGGGGSRSGGGSGAAATAAAARVAWMAEAAAETAAAAGSASASSQPRSQSRTSSSSSQEHQHHSSLEQRDADLAPLRHREVYGRTEDERRSAKSALQRELSRRQAVDSAALAAATHLLATRPHLAAQITTLVAATTTTSPTTTAATTSPTTTLTTQTLLARQLVHGPLGRPAPGVPLVDDWDCLRGMVAAWEGVGQEGVKEEGGQEGQAMEAVWVCGPMDQYAMRHTRLLANLCNAGVAPGELREALRAVGGCGGSSRGGEQQGSGEEEGSEEVVRS